MKNSYLPLLDGVVCEALQRKLIIPTPYKFENGDFIEIGHMVGCKYILDDENGIENGIVDFKNGCFVVVMLDGEDDGRLLHEVFCDLELLDPHDLTDKEMFEDYVSRRIST